MRQIRGRADGRAAGKSASRRCRSTSRRASTSRRSTRPPPTRSLRRRHRAIVEPREDAVGRRGLQRAIAEDVRGREVAAARRLEDLEHRMAVVQIAERAAAARTCDRRSRRSGQAADRLRPAATSCDRRRPRAARRRVRRNRFRTPPPRGRRKHRVVQDDHGALVERRRRQTRGRGRRRPGTTGVVPIDSAFDRNRLERGAVAAVDDRRATPAALGARTKLKVLSAGSGSVPARTEPRTFGAGQRELRER